MNRLPLCSDFIRSVRKTLRSFPSGSCGNGLILLEQETFQPSARSLVVININCLSWESTNIKKKKKKHFRIMEVSTMWQCPSDALLYCHPAHHTGHFIQTARSRPLSRTRWAPSFLKLQRSMKVSWVAPRGPQICFSFALGSPMVQSPPEPSAERSSPFISQLPFSEPRWPRLSSASSHSSLARLFFLFWGSLLHKWHVF